MLHSVFPPLPLDEWRASRDTVHLYSSVLSAIRQALMPPQKHGWHVSLRAAASGLTTTPIPAEELTFEILLDLATHELAITTSEGDWWNMSLRGQSARDFSEEVLTALRTLGVEVTIDGSHFSNTVRRVYDTSAVEDYWRAAAQIDILLKQFKGELHEETSPVQLHPERFELSLAWFSGNLVPGVGASDGKGVDEQMTFGFSTGDAAIPQPYFYVTTTPWLKALQQAELPEGAAWHTKGWKGALLLYDHLLAAEEPKRRLLNFWRTVQQTGAALMKQKIT